LIDRKVVINTNLENNYMKNKILGLCIFFLVAVLIIVGSGYGRASAQVSIPQINVGAPSVSGGTSVDVGGVNINTGGASGVNVTAPNTSVNVQNPTTGGSQINANGTEIKTNGTSGVNVNTGGSKVDIKSGADGASVTTESATVNTQRAADGMVRVNANGTEVNVGKSTTTGGNVISVTAASGNKIQVDTALGLGAQISIVESEGGLKNAVLSLEAGAAEMIKAADDLNAYINLTLNARPAVKAVEVSNGVVSVGYDQPARFLGIFKSGLSAKVSVDATGEVSMDLPWYSFLFSKNTKTVQTKVRANLASAKSNGLEVSALSSGSDEKQRMQASAKTVNVVSSAVEESASADSDESASADDEDAVCAVPAEFPFEKYPLIADLAVNSKNQNVIAKNIDANTGSTSDLFIVDRLDLTPNALVGTAYIFTSGDIQTGSTVDTLYVGEGTLVDQKGSVKTVVRLTKKELVKKAMIAAGLMEAKCE
jgi:hypothetical protein